MGLFGGLSPCPLCPSGEIEEEMENPEMVDLPEKLKHQLRHRELFLSRQLESLPATHIRYRRPGRGPHIRGRRPGQGAQVRYPRPEQGTARQGPQAWVGTGARARPDARPPVSCLAGGSAASLC